MSDSTNVGFTVYTNRQKWIYDQVAEMSKTLGIPVPTVLLAGIDGSPKELLGSRGILHYRWYLGYAFWKTHELYLNPRQINKYRYERSMKHVIAHEMVHLAFPRLDHGNSFEKLYVKALMEGHMVFYKHGKVEMIVTAVTKPKPEPSIVVETEIVKVKSKLKAWGTTRKRADTYIKKYTRKLKRLEEKKKQASLVVAEEK
jgi:hypothetical protein